MASMTLARRRNVRLKIHNRTCTNQRLVWRRDRGRVNVGRSAGARHDMREGGEAAMFSPSVAAVLPVLERTSGPFLSFPISFARYGTSSYRITATNLVPGEYALSRVYGQDVYCFGVD